MVVGYAVQHICDLCHRRPGVFKRWKADPAVRWRAYWCCEECNSPPHPSPSPHAEGEGREE
ncbi:MAG: hypothetical protein ACUVXI_05120 [bacterium]